MTRREIIGLAVFFLLAFGATWAGELSLEEQNPLYWFIAIFCSIGGFAASFAEGGTNGFREYCRRTLHLRGAVKYIFLGVLVPLVLGLLYLLSTGTSIAAFHPSLKAGLVSTLAIAWITGPLAEEFGWRGYLQNKLLSRMRPILVALIVAAIWCVWHLPVFYTSVFSSLHSSLGFAAHLLILSIFLVYLVPRAGGSVWPAVFFHWTVNIHATILGTLFPSVDGGQLPGGSNTLAWYGLAAGLFVAFQWRYFFGAATPRATSNNSFKPKPLRGSA